jgi:5-methylcytosine-specific restriction endonuclease McrA
VQPDQIACHFAPSEYLIRMAQIPNRQLPKHLQDLVDILPLDQPVHRTEIEQKYGRTNYARRIRKIVSEYGWEIERRREKNGANDDIYIRRSDGPVRVAHLRREVGPVLRRVVYARDKWLCQMCGRDVSDGQTVTRPQCDHKIPAERGGASAIENLMTLCTVCNLKKRQSCYSCNLPSCDQCPLAYPEDFAQTLVLPLSKDAMSKLNEAAVRSGTPAALIVMQLIAKAL